MKNAKCKTKTQNLKFFLLTLLFTLFALRLYALDVNLWKLPVPEQTEVVYQDKEIQLNGISAQATHLSSWLGVEELLNFYQGILTKEGWQIKDNFKNQNILALIKEGKFFYIGVQDNGKSFPRDVYLISSAQDLAICRIIKDYFLQEKLAEDAPGKDLTDIPRFPGAKRRLNTFAPQQGLIAVYEAEAPTSSISQFYRRILEDNGWQMHPVFRPERFKGMVPEAKGLEMLFFAKEQESLIINIFPVEVEGKQRAIIFITKNIQDIFSLGGRK
jgi:hypothetical protein